MKRTSPVCAGVDENGEIVWEIRPMERWQEILLFKKNYQGDFLNQWWHLSCLEKGYL